MVSFRQHLDPLVAGAEVDCRDKANAGSPFVPINRAYATIRKENSARDRLILTAGAGRRAREYDNGEESVKPIGNRKVRKTDLGG